MRLRGWGGAMSAIGAVSIVAAVALLTAIAITALDGDDADSVGLGGEQPPAEDADDRSATTTTLRRPTTTTATVGPEVLGERTTREPAPAPAPATAAPAPAPAPAPPAPATAPTSPPPTSPPPTSASPAAECRNSDDPACGTFRWDPEPAADDGEVDVVSAPTRAQVGEELTFTLDYVERAGAEAIGACGSWTVRGPGISNATTCEAIAHSCARYGPHDPPPPRADRVRVTRTITFTEPGTYEVSADGFTATHLADGCASPYVASWTVEPFTLTVVAGED